MKEVQLNLIRRKIYCASMVKIIFNFSDPLNVRFKYSVKYGGKLLSVTSSYPNCGILAVSNLLTRISGSAASCIVLPVHLKV